MSDTIKTTAPPTWNGLQRADVKRLRDSIDRWLADTAREAHEETKRLWGVWESLDPYDHATRRSVILDRIRTLNDGKLVRRGQVVLNDGLPAYLP